MRCIVEMDAWLGFIWLTLTPFVSTPPTHLFRTDFYLVVGCGDDDVFRGEISHVNRELVRIVKSLDISSST